MSAWQPCGRRLRECMDDVCRSMGECAWPPVRHADHDPALICRPALGYGLCEVLEPGSLACHDPECNELCGAHRDPTGPLVDYEVVDVKDGSEEEGGSAGER